MQITEATKAELRREKRGNKDFEAAAFEDNPSETKCGAEDLMRILGWSWMRMRAEDEDEQSQRHPHAWWDERYKWINEEGEKTCGRDVLGLE